MNDHRRSKDFCHYHPNHRLHGVCPLCLTDKLLAVAAEQSRRDPSHRRRPSNTADLPKISACASLLSRRRNCHRRQCGVDGGGAGSSDTESTSPSAQDSFISIKFEENGVGLWDNTSVSKNQPISNPKEGCAKVLVEHLRMPRGLLRWRKRIGRLLQLVRWKRPNKPHADAFGGVKIRTMTLTRRRSCKP